MKKPLKCKFKFFIAFFVIVLIVLMVVFIYPNIEFKRNGKLYVCRFNDNFSEFEGNASYNELYFYNKKRDISLKTFEVRNFLCFYLFTFEYVEGDARERQFILEEEFISYWLKNAQITENPDGIDIASLISGKKAIVGNTRYFGNEYKNSISYILDGKYDELYVFESGELTIIQVGSPDESPKFIAYK